MTLTAGTRLGHYEIIAPLGAGGMGEVYRARDTRLHREVALKLIPPGLVQDPERLRRFETEARAASALNHPAIVTVYDLAADAQPYISMELVEGRTLRAIAGDGALPVRRWLQIAAQVADGLAKAHEAGIVHRDLKPENIMVSSDGFAKILDFGLAKLVALEPAGVATQTLAQPGTQPGVVMGSAGYMSPEQARGESAGPASDQFSLGVVLYELLTGRRAFQRPTTVETMAAIVNDEPEPIERVKPDVPAPIRWIVERCLAKVPSERYASTRDLARDLAHARDRLSEISSGVGIGAPSLKKRRRREAIAWAAAIVLLATTAALVVTRGRRPAPPDPSVTRFVVPPPDGAVIYFPGVFGSPIAVSPDGRHIAFLVTPLGRPRQLFLRTLDSIAVRSLPGTEGALLPFWSPDSRSIGFSQNGKLVRTTIDGGEVRTICDMPAGGGGSWSKDDVIVFSPTFEAGFFRVPATGGVPSAVLPVETARGDSTMLWPVFLPDGRHFLFNVISGERSGIYAASLDGGERKLLLPGRPETIDASPMAVVEPGVLLYVRDRRLLAHTIDVDRLEMKGEPIQIADDVASFGPASAFSASANGVLAYWVGNITTTQPTWYDRTGKSVGTVGPPSAYVHLMISPDGRRVAADDSTGAGALWIIDVSRGSTVRVESRATFSPVWQPDGRALAFAAARGTPPNLFVQRLGEGGSPERLTRSPIQQFPSHWSPDGRWLVYAEVSPKTNTDLWLLALSGDRKPTPLIVDALPQYEARISPDGRWMAYSSNESGQYVTTFPRPGERWPVSVGGGFQAVWRRDGRELYYVGPGKRLMAVSIAAGDRFDAGVPSPLFELNMRQHGGLGAGWGYDVAPDGRFLVNSIIEQQSTPLTVVLNWRAAARP